MATSSSGEEQDKFIQTLPRNKAWIAGDLCWYKGSWIVEQQLEGILNLQKEFKPQASNVILATFPKSGTTWLKALLFTIISRNHYDYSAHPLLTMNPHDCVPWMENCAQEIKHIIYETPLLATHMPYACLPEQIKTSDCPTIYLCRNPKDVVVSLWSFVNKARVNLGRPCVALEEVVDRFCDGVSPYGPYWDHLLGFWNASLEFPHKVLFLMYEDLKRDPFVHIKRLAEFVRHPFTPEEERGGVIQKVIEFCSFEKLSSLVVNREEGKGPKELQTFCVTNKMFFRKGHVGDYKNYLTESMIKRLEEITEQKLQGSGITMPV